MTFLITPVRSFARDFRNRYPSLYSLIFRCNHVFWATLEVVIHFGFVPVILYVGFREGASPKNILIPFSKTDPGFYDDFEFDFDLTDNQAEEL